MRRPDMRYLGTPLALLLVAACRSADAGPAQPAPPASHAPSGAPSAKAAEALPAVEASYPWKPNAAGGRLDARFAAPKGFVRIGAPSGTFANFLRTLPLLPEGAKVVTYEGAPLHADGHHPNIAAVADLDIGKKDLQHCADVILRLHGEWSYGQGKRDITYRAVSGTTLSYKAWMAGDRTVIDGKNLAVRRMAAPAPDDHALFRAWMDDVFAWAGTPSIERDGKSVPFADVRGGDFFVLTGSPFGHAVLVLDVARDAAGRTALLLGQSYMPAQSFQILKPDGDGAWFVVDEDAAAVRTPFWKPFPLTSLRRLP